MKFIKLKKRKAKFKKVASKGRLKEFIKNVEFFNFQ